MATYNLVSNIQPEGVHAGLNALICRMSLSISNTPAAGDLFIIGKVPQGAIPIDAVFYPGAAHAAAQVFKMGTSASPELFFASASYSIALYRTTRPNLVTRQHISISDDAMPRYENLIVTPTSVGSVGHWGDFVVFYKLPGQTLP